MTNSTPEPDALEALCAWAAALTEAGWTAQPVEHKPAHLAGLRHLTDPAGRVQARAHAYRSGDIDVELRSSARAADQRPLWYVIAGWLRAPAVIAAARAAADDDSTGPVPGHLAHGGWRLQRYEALTATLAEHQWTSADETRWATYTTPDHDPDGDGDGGDGGWSLAYSAPDGHRQRITASASTPAALVATLARSA